MRRRTDSAVIPSIDAERAVVSLGRPGGLPAVALPGPRRAGRPGVRMTARSPDSGATKASIDVRPSQRRAGILSAVIPGWAIRHWPTSITWCERCSCSPATPSSRTANCTRVRQPRPPPLTPAGLGSASPGRGSTVTSRSRPASRASCWRMMAAFSDRCAGRLACCQSQPPQPPGTAYGQGGATRSGEAASISTASARASRDATSVTRARTRSPGSVCRTKTTGPSSGRATHHPPCAASPAVTSISSPTR